ncbi:MAG: hypothetical protein GX624_07605 [Actinobacteria bacterium]|nr:hypothetical protein [Actinomycetota bacterium]
MARACQGCGRSNDDDASFCQGCGAPLAEAPVRAAVPPDVGGHSRIWIVAIVVAVIVAIVAVAATAYFTDGGGGTNAGLSPAPSAEPTVAVSPAPEVERYLAGAVGPRADRLATISADGAVTPIGRFSGGQIRQIAYSPDGARLACVAGTLRRSELWVYETSSGAAKQATAAAPRVVAVDSVAWLSPTELLMAGHTEKPEATGQNGALLVYDVGSGEFSPLSDAAGVPLRGVAVSASRDGGRVAFVTYTDARTDEQGMASATERLQLLDRATRQITQLGENEAFFDVDARAFDEPLLSPDGEAVIYRRAGSDVGTSYTVVDADGARLMAAKEATFPAGYAWHPDGTRVVFTGHPVKPGADGSGVGPAVFWVFDTSTRQTQVLARQDGAMVQDLSWSPDGETIAWAGYDQDHFRTGTLYLMPSTGGRSRAFVKQAISPVWAPDTAPSLVTAPGS